MPDTNQSNYVVIEDFLTPEECKAFYQAVVEDSVDDPKPYFKYLHLVHSEDDVDGLPSPWNMGGKISSLIEYANNHFLENYKILGTLKFNRLFGNIMQEGSHLPGHRDEDPNPEGLFDGKKRSFVGSLLLNDNYEGGELLFSDQNAELKPKPGTLVLFPGYYTNHGVGNITSGDRVNLLIFFYDMLD
jgi:2OG-Fe(II) oxygenase superfamily